jgi:hypothetical protein
MTRRWLPQIDTIVRLFFPTSNLRHRELPTKDEPRWVQDETRFKEALSRRRL